MYISRGNYAVDTLEALYEDMQKDKLDHGNVNNFKNCNIEFENVSSAYNDKAVTENLSFKLEEGRSYALAGSSGSGKSTVAKLISNFYNVNEGKIRIGGIPIGKYSDKALVRAVSFALQDSKLFRKSIYDNVALANKGATKDGAMRALKLAGCDLILDKFPERENTVVDSKGIYLSGGEKQGVAIARAILKDSKITIMDEASASIDPNNEFELQRAFRNLMKNRTVIMIAHRLSTIKDLDEILAMDSGKVIERGSDRELMSSDTEYRKLQEMLSSVGEWRVSNEGVL